MENGCIDRVLKAFERYYDVKKDDIEPPFCAEAVFNSHTEQYFLVKEAKLSEADSNEYVFFGKTQELGKMLLEDLCLTAWKRGLVKAVPRYGHRNSDVSLIILSEKIDQDAIKLAKKINFFKSYKFGLWGFSRFKLIIKELPSGIIAYNRFGSEYRKILKSIV